MKIDSKLYIKYLIALDKYYELCNRPGIINKKAFCTMKDKVLTIQNNIRAIESIACQIEEIKWLIECYHRNYEYGENYDYEGLDEAEKKLKILKEWRVLERTLS